MLFELFDSLVKIVFSSSILLDALSSAAPEALELVGERLACTICEVFLVENQMIDREQLLLLWLDTNQALPLLVLHHLLMRINCASLYLE